MRMVAPAALSSRISSMIEAPVVLSRFPVGSSARTIAAGPPRRVAPADPDDAAARPLERPDDVQERGLARAGGPNDRHQLTPPDGEGHATEGGHRWLLPVDLRHPVQLQNRFAAHDEGTTTRSPTRTSPSPWTRPPAVSNRPSFPATRSRRRSARATSPANPPPDFPTIAVTGTFRAFSTPLVVISTCTGAWSSECACCGWSR